MFSPVDDVEAGAERMEEGLGKEMAPLASASSACGTPVRLPGDRRV